MNLIYNRLRGRIIEKYGSQAEFSEVLGITKTAMSLKMGGKRGFSQQDIVKWCELLDIDFDEIGYFFFEGKIEKKKR